MRNDSRSEPAAVEINRRMRKSSKKSTAQCLKSAYYLYSIRGVWMNRYQLSEILFSHMSIVEPYPEGVTKVPVMMDITAFFPGGRGLWLEEELESYPDILVLGQDFSTVSAYQAMLEGGRSDLQSPTWNSLIKLFEESGIPLGNCFFSNVFMGLRNTKSMIGTFPGIKNKYFVKRNVDFLAFQIKTIHPSIIITLGRPASEMMAKLSPDQLSVWEKGKALSMPNNGFIKNNSVFGRTIHCVALEHPSMRNSNVKRRRYKNQDGDYSGHTAEVEMLRDLIKTIR